MGHSRPHFRFTLFSSIFTQLRDSNWNFRSKRWPLDPRNHHHHGQTVKHFILIYIPDSKEDSESEKVLEALENIDDDCDRNGIILVSIICKKIGCFVRQFFIFYFTNQSSLLLTEEVIWQASYSSLTTKEPHAYLDMRSR